MKKRAEERIDRAVGRAARRAERPIVSGESTRGGVPDLGRENSAIALTNGNSWLNPCFTHAHGLAWDTLTTYNISIFTLGQHFFYFFIFLKSQ